MNDEYKKVWNEVLQSVRVSVSSAIYSTWLSQTHLASLEKSGKNGFKAEIGCNSTFVKNTIEQRYYGLIQDALSKTVERPCDLTFIVKSVPQKDSKNEGFDTPLFATKNLSEEVAAMLGKSKIRKGFTFDNFAVSSSNQMAWAAAESVSKTPGRSYNPLFIWGGVGVGKTHLMLAVGHSIIENNLDSKILFCTSEDFTNDIIEGIRNKTTQAFRDKYRKLDAILIDDIQFIAGKDAVQDEFFHTFNAVTSAGGQVVLTSDKPPSEIALLEERLRSRFEAGLLVDISPPDFELRCAIVQIKSQENDLKLDTNLVQLIASNINAARKIEGFITKLTSEVKLRKSPINEETIKNLIGKGVEDTKAAKRSTTPDEVVKAVCSHYSLKKGALLGKTRSRVIARPRQVLMYLLRTELGLPYQEVGRLVGRDHSTVIHAVDKITQLSSNNVQIRDDVLGIKTVL